MDKRIYFLIGLPRSGSTLLANILAQHPKIFVTPTSGIVDVLVQVRNSWGHNFAFHALNRDLSENLKECVLRGILQSYFSNARQPTCIDKSREWADYLEMAAVLVGGRERLKVLVTVRDLRDVLSSFEQLYRKTSALGYIHQEGSVVQKFRTVLGRLEIFMSDDAYVGRACNAIRDAVTRGWRDCMYFVEYDQLTRDPESTLKAVYRFLGEDEHRHDFDNVEQTTIEDDFVFAFKDLHKIRHQVKPQDPSWPIVFDESVFRSRTWQEVANAATFWHEYQQQRET